MEVRSDFGTADGDRIEDPTGGQRPDDLRGVRDHDYHGNSMENTREFYENSMENDGLW